MDKKKKSRNHGLASLLFIAGMAVPIAVISQSDCNKNNNQVNPVPIGAKVETVAVDTRTAPEKRQAYLDDLLKNTEIPYCSGVVYDHDGLKIVDYLISEAKAVGMSLDRKTIDSYKKEFRNGDYDAKVPDIVELSGLERKSIIFVGRQLFNEETSASDFKCTIIAHEGRHVEQHAKGIGYLSKEEIITGVHAGAIAYPVLYEVCELDANYKTLKRIASGEFKTDRDYELTLKNYEINRAKLTFALDESSDIQKRLINNALEATRDLK